MAYEDEKLVNKFKQGDREAFNMLVARYEQPIYNTAYRIFHNAEDAADITQTAFARAFEKIDTYNPAYKFFTWLYKIAVNESYNTLNRRKRRSDFEYDPPAAIPSPDEDLRQGEMGELLQQALDRMSLDHRLVIVLKHLLQLPYQEIAVILDIPQKTVKSRLYSARQSLKEQLMKQGYAG